VPRFRRSNPLALAVLTCLHERPMHPYEVAQTLRHRVKHESIKLNYGSLYSVVESLLKHGLIEATETVREGRRPERTIYAITDDGRIEMTEWLSDLVTYPANDYTQLEAGLSLIGALSPRDALAALHGRTQNLVVELERQRAVVTATAKLGLPRLFTLEAGYRVAMLETELTFVEQLVKDIETDALEGIDLWRALYRPDGSLDPAIVRATAERFGDLRVPTEQAGPER
jgi:DNA-binding PadR family transcriptional regulator